MSASKSQFSTAKIMYAVNLSGAAVALFGFFGLPIAAFLLLVWWQILSGARRESQSLHSRELRDSRGGKSHVGLVVALFVSAVVVGLLLPARVETDPMLQSQSSMKAIAKALASYEQSYQRLPPVITYDQTGRPMHSWRALILEQLGEQKLAAAYRLDEPWDGPNNAQLAKYQPWYYRDFLAGQNEDQHLTSVHFIPTGNQPLIVEHEQLLAPWLKPTETTMDEWNSLQHVPRYESGFWHAGFLVSKYRGRLAVVGDQVFTVHPNHALVSNHGIDATSCTIGQPTIRYHTQNAIRLGVFLAVALYPLRWWKRL